MGKPPRKTVFAGAMVGILAITSCAPRSTPVLISRTAEAREYFLAGDWEKALTAYEEAHRKYPGDKKVLEEYILAVEKMKALADQDFEGGEFAAAERRCGLLLLRFSSFAGFESSLSFTRPALRQKIVESRKNLGQRLARQSLEAGDFQKALDAYLAFQDEVPAPPVLAAGLLRTAEEIKRRADQAVDRLDFATAGKGYSALKRNYREVQKLGAPLPFSSDILDHGVGRCRTELTRQGLDYYRKGKLKEAIETWKGLLEFDPENAEIQNAVETATQQLKKLKKEL
jgi:tetratricopeptide (TPR) repeat protein